MATVSLDKLSQGPAQRLFADTIISVTFAPPTTSARREGVQICPHPTGGGVPRMQKFRTRPVGARAIEGSLPDEGVQICPHPRWGTADAEM